MDANFWVGIVLGAIVSLGGSFVANFYTDRLKNYLERRNVIRLSGRKSRELKTYAFAKALSAGDPVATLVLHNLRDQSLRFYFLTILFFMMATSSGLLVHMNSESSLWKLQLLTVGTALFALATFSVGFLSAMSVRQIVKKAALIEAYGIDIRAKWGSDAI